MALDMYNILIMMARVLSRLYQVLRSHLFDISLVFLQLLSGR